MSSSRPSVRAEIDPRFLVLFSVQYPNLNCFIGDFVHYEEDLQAVRPRTPNGSFQFPHAPLLRVSCRSRSLYRGHYQLFVLDLIRTLRGICQIIYSDRLTPCGSLFLLAQAPGREVAESKECSLSEMSQYWSLDVPMQVNRGCVRVQAHSDAVVG